MADHDDINVGEAPNQTTPGIESSQLAGNLNKWVSKRKKYWKDEYKAIQRHRKLARGVTNGDDTAGRSVHANLIHSTIRSLIPHIYAKNPEIVVKPSEAAGDDRYQSARAFSQTLQTVLQRSFVSEAKLKKRAKKAVRAALTSRIGWAKLTYQREFDTDPEISNRMADAQEQINHIEKLQRDLTDPDEIGREEATREELLVTVRALEAEVDIVVAEGLVLDILGAESIILDSNVESLDEFEMSNRIAQEFYKPLAEAQEIYKDKLEKATKYFIGPNLKPTEDNPNAGGDAHTVEAQICGREIWDRITRTVYTVAVGMDDWLKDPWIPERQGEQWYPFFPLAFNLTDGYLWPLDMPELLEELTEEYNATRTQQAEHRELSIPHYIADKGTDTDTLERQSIAGFGEIVLVDAQGRPIDQVIKSAVPPPYNPQIYDTTPIRSDIDAVSGLQDAARGGIVKPKTATEAGILEAGLSSRTGEMQDDIEDWISDMAGYGAQVLLQELTPSQVARIAGNGAEWPTMDKEDLFDLVDVEIRAGTSGKPDRARERAQWGEILPMIQGLVDRAEQQQLAGGDPRPTIELLRMTLRRFDERVDLEQILPESLLQFVNSGRTAAPAVAQPAPGQIPGTPAGLGAIQPAQNLN